MEEESISGTNVAQGSVALRAHPFNDSLENVNALNDKLCHTTVQSGFRMPWNTEVLKWAAKKWARV